MGSRIVASRSAMAVPTTENYLAPNVIPTSRNSALSLGPLDLPASPALACEAPPLTREAPPLTCEAPPPGPGPTPWPARPHPRPLSSLGFRHRGEDERGVQVPHLPSLPPVLRLAEQAGGALRAGEQDQPLHLRPAHAPRYAATGCPRTEPRPSASPPSSAYCLVLLFQRKPFCLVKTVPLVHAPPPASHRLPPLALPPHSP